MAQEWYFMKLGSEVGPIASAELRDKALAGVIDSETPVRNSPDAPWAKAGSIKGLSFAREPRPQLLPPTPEAVDSVEVNPVDALAQLLTIGGRDREFGLLQFVAKCMVILGVVGFVISIFGTVVTAGDRERTASLWTCIYAAVSCFSLFISGELILLAIGAALDVRDIRDKK